MKICIHAGHNPDGKVACGAVGYGKESTLAREVCAYLCEYLARYAEIDAIVNATCNDGKNARDVINKVIQCTNIFSPDISVSIHFNSSVSPQANGCEVWYYTGNELTHGLSDMICNELEKYGYRRRGSKPSESLAVLRRIKCDSVLVECAFVSNEHDMNIFNSRQVAKRIAKGIAKYYNLKEV